MAVIITDMDMPRSCPECQFFKNGNGLVCPLTCNNGDCPLKSADEMIAEIETDMSWDMYDENGNETDLHKRLMSIIHRYTDKEDT